MRVFINDLTSYHGKALISYCASATFAEDKFHIVGSAKDSEVDRVSKHVDEFCKLSELDSIAALVSSADVIVYSLEGHLEATAEAIRVLSRGFDGSKVFIGISSVLTWGKTAKAIVDDAVTPFEEADYLKRKPTSKYIPYKAVETQILAASTPRLRTLVVGAGIAYGEGELALEKLFETAWLCQSEALLIPSLMATGLAGANKLPMIHVSDLARLVIHVARSPPEDCSYILGLDSSSLSLREVATTVAEALGRGRVRDPTADDMEELMLDDGLAMLQVDLSFNVESSAAGKLEFDWVAKTGLAENIAHVIAQYTAARNLRPIRCVIMGPPASGKSYWGSQLASAYAVPLVRVKDAIEEAKASDDVELVAAMQKCIDEAKDKRLSASLIARVVRKALRAPERRNKGWVLDGLPRSYDEASLIFTQRGEDDAEVGDDADESSLKLDPMLAPTTVAILKAEDPYLQARIRELPEDKVKGTHNTEEGLKRRLAKYRDSTNTAKTPDTAQSYFEAVGKLDTLLLPVKADTAADSILGPVRASLEARGKAFNFRPTAKEAQASRLAAETVAARAAAEKAMEERSLADAEDAKAAMKQEKRLARLEEIAKNEGELLESRSKPLRTYLMKNVMPTLTMGLIEVCKNHPDDPVDFLAEYLFKHSS